jgi:hypothetical protein
MIPLAVGNKIDEAPAFIDFMIIGTSEEAL